MPNKRGNGDGNFRERPDGRWEGRITLSDGTRKSVYGTTRAEAKRRATIRELSA